VMASLTSWHQTTFLAVALPILAIALFIERRPAQPLRSAAQLVAAAALAALVVAPFALPYLRVERRDPHYTRTLEQAASISAHPSSYLAAPRTSVVYGALTGPARDRQTSLETELFPGVLVPLLAIGGVGAVVRRRGARAVSIGFAAVAIGGVVLAFGTAPRGYRRLLPWRWLSEHIVLFRAIRAPARAHVLTVLGLAALASFGAAALLKRAGGRRAVAAVVLTLAVLAEGLSIPLRLGSAPRPPEVYRTLASRPGAVLELPMTFREGTTWNATYRGRDLDYMLMGVAHWRPLANGALGYTPPGYWQLAAAAAAIPDAASTALLRARGIRTLILHTNDVSSTPWRDLESKLARVSSYRVIARDGPIVVYDVSLS